MGRTLVPDAARAQEIPPQKFPPKSVPTVTRFPPMMGVVCALVLLALALLGSVLLGGLPTTLPQVWHAFFHFEGTESDVAIAQLRWPRTITGLVVGAALGVAGTLTQGHTRNPIADPGLLGIYAGAALSIVAGTLVFGSAAESGYFQATLAFLGALGSAVLVFFIGSASRHGVTNLTLVLAGAAVTAFLGGIVSMIVLSNANSLDTLRFWQLGSIAMRGALVPALLPFFVLGLILAPLNSSALNALALGDETAASLGYRVRRARTLGVVAIALLAATAVTLAGPIAFAGLFVPYLARWLAGHNYAWQIPCAAILGSAVLLLADTVGRVAARPGELPVGVVLAVIGAPFFVFLARRRKVSGL